MVKWIWLLWSTYFYLYWIFKWQCLRDLPQFSGGVRCSTPQQESCRKLAAGRKWNPTDSWPSWRDPFHHRGDGRSESTSGCWSTATLHHASPWITSLEQQWACCDSAFQNSRNVINHSSILLCRFRASRTPRNLLPSTRSPPLFITPSLISDDAIEQQLNFYISKERLHFNFRYIYK